MILGGGFAGLRVAQVLAAAKRKDLEIILIDQKDFFASPQNLYNLAVSSKGVGALNSIPYAKILNSSNTIFVKKKIIRIEPDKNKVYFDDNSEYSADFLVIALGSQISNLNGLENCFSVKSTGEALRLNRHLREIFVKYKTSSLEKKRQEFSIGIIGGGATGVELAGILTPAIKKLAVSNRIDPRIPKITIYESKREILNHLPGFFRKVALENLKEIGADIKTYSEIVLAGKGFLENKKGENFLCAVPIFAGGVRAHDVLIKSGLVINSRGGLAVDGHLSPVGYPKIFAAGDCTYAFDPEAQKLAPDVISAALEQADVVAENIIRKIDKETPILYLTKSRSVFLAIGGKRYASINGKEYSGFLASAQRRYYILKSLLKIMPLGTALALKFLV